MWSTLSLSMLPAPLWPGVVSKQMSSNSLKNKVPSNYSLTKDIYIYIYREREREKLKNKVIQSNEFIVKESQRYKVLILTNHHEDFENRLYQVLIDQQWIFNNIQQTRVSLWCNDKSNGLRNRSKRVRTPIMLLHSLSGK